MQIERAASVTEITNKGKRVYRLNLGEDDKGKRLTHDFHSRDSADCFKKICEEAWKQGLPTPIPDLGLPTSTSKASIIQVRNRSGSITYRVSFSVKGGKRFHRGFDTSYAAEQFQKLVNDKHVAGKKADMIDLAGVYRHEILAGVEKLKAVGASITEAVDFYLKFAKPVHGDTTVKQGIAFFLDDKGKMGRSSKYLRNCKEVYFAPFEEKFGKRVLNEILGSEIGDYLGDQEEWSNNTKNFHRNYLSTLYGWWIWKGFAKRNPLREVEAFQSTEPPIRVLPTLNVRKLLDFALDSGLYDECASMVLVFFCGVRVDEVDRLEWRDIDLEGLHVILQGAITKKGKRRNNPISDNARFWLEVIRTRLCAGKPSGWVPVGRIAPADYTQRMRRMRRAAGLTSDEYPQNSMRHSFCAYHSNFFHRPQLTSWMLGHPDPTLLYNTYNAIVTPTEAKRYWQIYPGTDAGQEREAEFQQSKEELGLEFSRKEAYPQLSDPSNW